MCIFCFPNEELEVSFGRDWAYESPSNMGNVVDGPPQRVQIAPVVVHYFIILWRTGCTTQTVFGISGLFSYHSDVLSFVIPGLVFQCRLWARKV